MRLAGGAVIAAGAAPVLGTAITANARPVRVLGVACSPRRGKTTATAVNIALEAAKAVSPRIEVELIDLGGMTIAPWAGGARPVDAVTIDDDFETIRPRIETFDGLIIGSPSYFRGMSALCKAFIERCAVFQAPELVWAGRPLGALATGGFRNGGQELVIQQIQTTLLTFEMTIVGGKPRAHQGATLWNQHDDDITQDAVGVDTANKLGQRVAEAALLFADAKQPAA
ncbi:MAG: flavodoxin family protein [Chromatiaceae bacterium]|nr:MAG: flavodoxin family protein [Chromatiaceae bacterium]